MKSVIKYLWISLCIILIAIGTYMGGETELVALYGLTLLTLPASIIAMVLLFPLIGVNSSLGAILSYSLMLLFGYIQWFVLFPRALNRMKAERSPMLWGLVLLALLAVLFGLYRFYIHVFPSHH
ncbi:MAG: hypothetical protein KF802_04045 [Bdellovibrionaceae bacterium]|nr:hypothetical protein [Pseudobdellovibrionaceae bacterium]